MSFGNLRPTAAGLKRTRLRTAFLTLIHQIYVFFFMFYGIFFAHVILKVYLSNNSDPHQNSLAAQTKRTNIKEVVQGCLCFPQIIIIYYHLEALTGITQGGGTC